MNSNRDSNDDKIRQLFHAASQPPAASAHVQREIFEKIRMMERQEIRNKFKGMFFKTSLLTCLATAASVLVAVISQPHPEKELTQIVWEKDCSICGDYLDVMNPIIAVNEPHPRR